MASNSITLAIEQTSRFVVRRLLATSTVFEDVFYVRFHREDGINNEDVHDTTATRNVGDRYRVLLLSGDLFFAEGKRRSRTFVKWQNVFLNFAFTLKVTLTVTKGRYVSMRVYRLI